MPPVTYSHKHKSGSHYDVLKNVAYMTTVRLIQEQHPDGVVLIETHSGPGIYDEVSEEYLKAAARVIDKNLNAPPQVKKYVSLLNKLKKEFGDGALPGSPVFSRELMRENDGHRLVDRFEDNVEGIFEDARFQKMDAYDPATLDFLMPHNDTLHPIVLIDPAYDDPQDMLRVQDLFARILQRNSEATVVVWIPFIRNDRSRWNFPKAMKELAKDKASIGRYYCSLIVAKDGLEGGAVLVANPTREMVDVLNEDTLEWLASTMNQGKADYSVEQAMKKKKVVTPG